MKSILRLSPLLLFAVLSCQNQDATAPLAPELSLRKHDNGGNPDCQVSNRGRGTRRGPLDFLCAIALGPGNPLTSSQKGWMIQETGTYYLTDAANNGVDVIDIKTHTWKALIPGFVGNVTAGGGTATSNGAGPNAFVSAPSRGRNGWWDHGRGRWGKDDRGDRGPNTLLWVSDGNSQVRVVDPEKLEIIATINTAIADCDGGTETTHYCGRSNEIAYDPVHHVVVVSNPSALDVAAPHTGGWGFATFISAREPFKVLGHIRFNDTGNVEGHIWVPQLNRFLLPIQPTAANQATKGTMYIAVINTRKMEVEEKRVYFCPEIPGTVPTSTGNNNLQLAGNNLWAQMCGRPIRMNVRTGDILNVIAEVGTGDQDWFNPGDGNFYVTGQEQRAAAPGIVPGTSSLGVMSAFRGTWLQNVPNLQGASPVAFARTNEIFTRVVVTPAMVANPALDLSRCVVKGRGCVVVFVHTGEPDDDEK